MRRWITESCSLFSYVFAVVYESVNLPVRKQVCQMDVIPSINPDWWKNLRVAAPRLLSGGGNIKHVNGHTNRKPQITDDPQSPLRLSSKVSAAFFLPRRSSLNISGFISWKTSVPHLLFIAVEPFRCFALLYNTADFISARRVKHMSSASS